MRRARRTAACVADGIRQCADDEREAQAADPRRHASEARGGPDFGGLEDIGGECVDELLTSAEIIWCAKPPTQNSAMASYGDATSSMHAGPIIMNAPSTTPVMRDAMSGTRKHFIRNR